MRCLSCLLPLVTTVACAQPKARLCDIVPSPSFAVLPDTVPAGVIRGVVIALPDSAGVRDAHIRIDGTAEWTQADSLGRFQLSEVRPGPLTLVVLAIHRKPVRIHVTNSADRGTGLVLPMVRSCVQMKEVHTN
jgi:hypothetical protein